MEKLLIDKWLTIGIAFSYLFLLFVIAYWGEKKLKPDQSRPWIYSLSLAVYCTSWAMYGTVGQSQSTGWFFAPTYVGTILVFIFGWPYLSKLISLSKTNNVTSIADFIASRFGQSHLLGGLVVVTCLIAVIPYISLQLKAIVNSYVLITEPQQFVIGQKSNASIFQDTAFYVALVLAFFTILFGTRRLNATEDQPGVMLAIAFESVVKLVAFMLVGLFCVYGIFNGFSDLWTQALEHPKTKDILFSRQHSFVYMSQVFLGAIAIVCLPRQFHVLVVENRSADELKKSRWIFPTYLFLINLFILPIALAGTIIFEGSNFSADNFLLILPTIEGSSWLSLLAFIGGLSAATGMIIVASFVLSTMISNEIIVPFSVKFFSLNLKGSNDISQRIILVRRCLILIILMLAYGYYQAIAVNEKLASTGLLSMTLIAQLTPALLFGVYWKACSTRAIITGLCVGLLFWSFTLLLPLLHSVGFVSDSLIEQGLLGVSLLRPTELLGLYGFDTISHGLIWSLSTNFIVVIALSVNKGQSLKEKILVTEFLSLRSNLAVQHRTEFAVSIPDLVVLTERFMGQAQANGIIKQYCHLKNIESIDKADNQAFCHFIEQQLRAIIGATSTRIIFESLEKNSKLPFEQVVDVINEAADVLLFNRELLQSAIENISHGISVVDKDLRLVAWNSQYVDLFNYPPHLMKVGQPIADLVRYNAMQGMMGGGKVEEIVNKRIEYMRQGSPHIYERKRHDGLVLEMRGNPMPGGGFVTSFIDITDLRLQQEELEKINLELESRVSERTQELEGMNQLLTDAKIIAEKANRSKTRFLAAASHDVLQPLNVAALFTASLYEKSNTQEQKDLTQRIHKALYSAENLLKDLIDISKLDSGTIKPNLSQFSITELLNEIGNEFKVLAQENDIRLTICSRSLYTESDRTMVRRIIQNLLTNAIKHSKAERLFLGCRKFEQTIQIHVIDHGIGIHPCEQDKIYQEFVQLNSDTDAVDGHGLGLAIVSRMAETIQCEVKLQSKLGVGSDFHFELPLRRSPTQENKPNEMTTELVPKRSVYQDFKLLVIDNEKDILEAMDSLLRSWGFQKIHLSTDGLNLSLGSDVSDPYDLIFADYHLENNRTGIDVLKEINATRKQPIPSVIITADKTEEISFEVEKSGYFLLNKPIKPLALKTLINRILGQ